jgi:hypothetical protein
LRALEAEPADLLTADGYIFAGPENLGAVAGLTCRGVSPLVVAEAGEMG